MRELSASETSNYLEKAIGLEVSLYTLENTREQIQRRRNLLKNRLEFISKKPSSSYIEKPLYSPPKEPVKPEEPEKRKTTVDDLSRHSTLFGWAVEMV